MRRIKRAFIAFGAFAGIGIALLVMHLEKFSGVLLGAKYGAVGAAAGMFIGWCFTEVFLRE